MNENYQEYYWHTLDNAAKLYSSVSTENITNVFRISAMLSEEVQPEILQEALEKTLEEIPFFRVKMRKGFFWMETGLLFFCKPCYTDICIFVTRKASPPAWQSGRMPLPSRQWKKTALCTIPQLQKALGSLPK